MGDRKPFDITLNIFTLITIFTLLSSFYSIMKMFEIIDDHILRLCKIISIQVNRSGFSFSHLVPLKIHKICAYDSVFCLISSTHLNE